MGTPAKRRKISISKAVFLSILVFVINFPSLPANKDSQTRIVNIKIAADSELMPSQNFMRTIQSIIMECNREFQNHFNIGLRIQKIEYWDLEKQSISLSDSFNELTRKVFPMKCDIVLGVISDRRCKDTAFGFSSYFNGYILVKHLESKKLMTIILLHELCHVFGAVDIHEIGSIMDIDVPVQIFDKFTTKCVLLNRNRSFQLDPHPLTENQLEELISLYKNRAVRDLGEFDIHRFLAQLYLKNKEYALAEEECAKIRRFSSRKEEAFNLFGNIHLKQGEFERAIEEYQKALKYLPDLPEIHFNLGLAYLKKGMLGKAISEFQKTIKLNPHFSEAHACLGYLFFKVRRIDDAIKCSGLH